MLTRRSCRWERMKSELQAPAIGTFDTDIVNAMFKNTALLLPGDYLTPNSHWETNEIPSWWQGIAPSRDPDWQPSPFSPPGSQASSDSTSMNTAEWEEAEQRKAEMKTAHLQQQEVRERGLRLRRALRDAYGEVKVLHFTALGKPWTWSVDRVIETKPDANPLLAVQFGEWRQAAKVVCPGMGNIEV